jgi:hypothetical protein
MVWLYFSPVHCGYYYLPPCLLVGNEMERCLIKYAAVVQVQLMAEEEAVRAAPNFTKPLRNVEAPEGQNIHLEARLSPTGDSTMRIEWTVNGKPLKTGIKLFCKKTSLVIRNRFFRIPDPKPIPYF